MPSRAMYQMSVVIVKYRESAPPPWVNLPGRLFFGTQLERIVSAPVTIPDAPKPATARPTISIDEETAAPQSKEPSSKVPKKARNVHYSPIRNTCSPKSSACDEPLCQSGCISFPLEVKGPHLISCQNIGAYILQNRIPSLPAKLIGTGIPTNVWK